MPRALYIILFLFILYSGAYGEDSTFYYSKGVESFKAGNMADAESSFRQALIINPSYTLGHYGLGRVYSLKKEKVPDAIKHFRKAVSLDPGFVKGWFKLGLIELVSGRYVESLHSFREAYERDKTFVEALYNMGVVYDILGDNYKAFTYYRLYYRGTRGKKDTPF